MASFLPEPSPAPVHDIHSFLSHDTDDDDADTASQRSISLSSPAASPRNSALNGIARQTDFRDLGSSKRESHPYTVDTDFGSDADSNSMFSRGLERQGTPDSSTAPSIYSDEPHEYDTKPTYPPSKPNRGDDRASISSFASTSSRKTRPESLIVNLPNGPIILGVALVDFNHLIGPRIEYSQGEIFEDEEIAKILPFLALPDGAHLSAEDYSYFHLVPSGPNPSTIFGISCNQQIASSALLVKTLDVTRSIVQKAVVVLASKPVFGPIRDKLGVVTTALFNQRDFTDASILDDFATQLELSLRGQLTESGLYMGTSLRELVHMFRQRTLVLVKALMLQKRIMFYGHPVERLCTYQYSLVSLLPGLLQTLDDCGSPPLASRAPTLSRPTSLKTSDPKSMMAFMGLPLDIFGKDSFFQPYLPLQQLDVLQETAGWLCGSTNSIVTQQNEIDLLVNIETGTFEFRNPHLERLAALTAADRKWMEEIVADVNEGWNDQNPTQSMHFKGSDDYLRTKFEEYIFAALSTVKYQDFISKGEGGGVIITGGTGGDSTSAEDFNPLWIVDFKRTNAYAVWNQITDPLIFDIIEPRHPCNEKPSVVADIGLRLSEGIQDLKLEQQLAPAREAVSRAVTVGSANFFKAVEGVRDRWAQRTDSSTSSTGNSLPSTPVEVSKADLDGMNNSARSPPTGLRPFSLRTSSTDPTTQTLTTPAQSPAASPSKNLREWGAGIGSFISSRAPMFTMARRPSEDGGAAAQAVESLESKPVPAPPPEPLPKVDPVPRRQPTMHAAEPIPRVEPVPRRQFTARIDPAPRVEPVTRRQFTATVDLVTRVEPVPETESVPKAVPVPKTKPPPPPVQVPVIDPADEYESNGQLTPQPFKTVAPAINVTTPGGSKPNDTPEPRTPTVVTTPKPRARLARSNTIERPTAGLWEDNAMMDDITKNFGEISSKRTVGKAEVKVNQEGVVEKERTRKDSTDTLSTYSKDEDDPEDAYSGMAL